MKREHAMSDTLTNIVLVDATYKQQGRTSLNGPLDQPTSAGLEQYLFAPDGVAVVEWMERWLRRADAGCQMPDTGCPNSEWVVRPRRFRHVLIETRGETTRQISHEDFGS